jgi:hypothetical protein
MALTTAQIEERLVRVESEIKELKARMSKRSGAPWWQEIDGAFEGDQTFARIVRMGAAIRNSGSRKRR